jgi:hypothetical protein
MSIGQPLEKLRKDFELLPNEVLIQYRSDPAKDAEGLPMSLLAGMELARRAAFQSQAAQQAAANTPPTVVDGATQALGLTPPPAPPAQPAAAPGQPPVAPGGIAGVPAQPTAAPQPMQQAPQPMQQAPQPMQQAPQPMQQAPAPGFSGGGAVAFAEGGMSQTPDAYLTSSIEDIEDDPSLPLSERKRRTLARIRQSFATRSDDSDLSLSQRWNKPEGPRVSDVYPETVGNRYPTYVADSRVRPSEGNAGAQSGMSALEQSLIASGVTDPAERRTIIEKLKGKEKYTYRVPGAPGQPTSAGEPPSGLASLQAPNPRADAVYGAADALAKFYAEPNTPMTEEEREKRFKAAFDRRQAMLDPQFSKMQELIGKENMAASRSDAGNMGLMDLGLRMMTGRGSLSSIIGESGLGAMGTYAKQKEREMSAQSAARKLEMGLLGDQMRASGQNFEGAEAAAVRAEALKRQEYADRERALRGGMDAANTALTANRNVEGDALRQRAAEQVDYYKKLADEHRQRGQAVQAALLDLKVQEAQRKMLEAGQKALPTPAEMIAVRKYADETWQQEQSRYLSPEVVNALRTPALAKQPAVMAAVDEGKRRYLQDLMGGTGKASAPISSDAAFAVLGGGR